MKKLIYQCRSFHYLLNLDENYLSQQIQGFTYFLYLTQLFNIGGEFKPQPDIITIYSLIRGTFIFNIIDEKYLTIIQILFLILNIILIISLCANLIFNYIKNSKKWKQLIIIINLVINVYPQVLFIPIIWLNIKLCFTQSLMHFAIALINLSMTILLTFLIVFFQRGDALHQYENVSNNIILIRILVKLFELMTIYFSFLNHTFTFIFQIIVLLSNISLNAFKFTEQSNIKVRYNLLFLVFIITLQLNLTLMDYLIISTVVILFYTQLLNIKTQQILVQGDSILLCQLAEKIYKNCLVDKQARIQLQIFKNNHKCMKCKAFYDIIECILKRKARNERDKLIYANFVQNKWPLRALVELHKEQNEDFYYQSALLTFQKLNISKIEIANYIYTTYQSQKVCQLVIDQLQKIMENLIKFWNQTVMNQFDLIQFYQSSRRIGLEIKQLNLLFQNIYNLNNHKIWGSQSLDVISLRLQQVYYCVAKVDLVKAQQMEEKINEVFRFEKYQQFMTIDSNQLVMNRSLLLRTSLIYNVNKLIKPNYEQMSQFLETSIEETSFIKSSLDLMPNYLASIHDQLTEAFIQKGQSHLSQQGQSTFCQNPKGYIVPCYIHILPFQGDNDYFINAIITKEQNYNEQIIFGMNGRLYGMTQNYFEFTLQSLIFDNYSKRISINEIIEKGALIQYYIENIIEQIYNLKLNIEKHQNYTLNELISYWQYPDNHFNCVFSTNQIMRQQYSSNHVLSFSNFISQKTYLQTSKPSTVQISEFDESLQNSKELNLDGCEWQILNNNYNNSIRQMLDQLGDSQKTNRGRIQIIYSLSFRKILIGKKTFGYFILEIKDCKQDYTQKHTSNYFTSYQTRKSESSKVNKSSYDFPVEDIEIINSERPQSNEEIENQIKHIKLKNHLLYLNKLEHERQILFNNYLSSVSVTKQKMQSYDFENTSRLLKLQTDRQPKKQLLTTRIELQSINIQQDDDDIIQAVEQEFQEIVFERKVINQQQQDEDNNDYKIKEKQMKESNLKIKTKAQFEFQSNQTFKKKINILKEAFLYLDYISQSKFTLSCLKKFTYFSICVIFLLITNIVLESYEVQKHIQGNDSFIQNTLTKVEFHKSLAIKLNLYAIFKLSKLSIINKNQYIIQMAQTQAYLIYHNNIYNKEYSIINHYINNENVDLEQFYIILEQFNNEMRQIYYNSTFVTFNFTNHTHYMFTYFYKTIIQDLDQYKDQQPDLIQTMIFTLLSFSFVIYQIRFLYAKQQVIIQILKLIQQTNIIKIQNHIARLSIIKETFKIDKNQHYESNSKNWKLTSYISIIQEDPNLERQQNKKIHELEGTLNHRYIYPNCIVVTVLCLFILTGSLLQQNYYKDRFLEIEKQFIKLNLVLDSGLLYGTLIKTNRILDISDQLTNKIITQFNDSMNLLIEISNEIIINLEYLQEDSILNILISDYCINYMNDIKYCYDDQYPYKEMHSLIDRGMMSLINNIEKVKITEFLFELSNNQFDNNLDELINFLQSQTFINTFLVYFSETTNIFSDQLIEIYNFESEYYSKYVLVILFYEIAVGISVGLMYLLYGYLTQLYHKIDFQYIILFLRTMPYEQIQQKNFLHQMKTIMQSQ